MHTIVQVEEAQTHHEIANLFRVTFIRNWGLDVLIVAALERSPLEAEKWPIPTHTILGQI
jgi:hypothetical protein